MKRRAVKKAHPRHPAVRALRNALDSIDAKDQVIAQLTTGLRSMDEAAAARKEQIVILERLKDQLEQENEKLSAKLDAALLVTAEFARRWVPL